MSDKLKTTLAVLASFAFLLIALYFVAAASGHPRLKHALLFIGLAAVSALVAWFTLPPRDAGA